MTTTPSARDTQAPATDQSRLAQLRRHSVIVADTGDFEVVRRLRPVDCTTNPSLVLKALDLPVYAELIESELRRAASQAGDIGSRVEEAADRLAVGVGAALAGLVPGRVSTEVDADLAQDTEATVAKARRFIALYREAGLEPERVLIKVAATWAGIEAARVLQREGIDCNLTLVFNRVQALACAEAGAFLISPFVGRILDWHVAHAGRAFTIDEDPGVIFVRDVYREFKRRGLETVVMGASFRSTAQIEALAGCDRLTISPALLEELDAAGGEVPRQLSPGPVEAKATAAIDRTAFDAALAQDRMAREKLDEGVATFAADLHALRERIAGKLATG
ncbi:transaldolase [Luteimonas suaedae]|uniref:transaldolase n=1 Tax=Luteimonas suaedae TaxID=2605430 RepID=UPI0011EC48EC|nr:transaldolase [Luteimonas suaedae]